MLTTKQSKSHLKNSAGQFKYLLLILVWAVSTTPLTATNLIMTSPNSQYHSPVSIFDDTITNERVSQINTLFAYSIPTDKVAAFNSGTGSSASVSNSMAVLSTGTTNTGYANLTTYSALQYVPAHDSVLTFSARFTAVTAGATAWIGAMAVPFPSPATNTAATDAYAIGYNGTQFSLLHRSSLASEVIIPATSFNIDPLDGSGPSGIVLDGTKVNVFRIQYGWLGSAPAIFSIINTDGQWYKFHVLQNPNNTTAPALKQPMMQIRAEVNNNSLSTTSVSLHTACWDASTVGSDSANIVRTYEFGRELTAGAALTTTETPIFSIRNQITYNSLANYMAVKLIFTSACSSGTASIGRFRLIKNGTLTGASFAAQSPSPGPSCVFIDTAATAISGGAPITGFLSSNNIAFNLPLLASRFNVLLAPGDIITLTGKLNTTDNSNQATVTLTWQEPVA